MKANTEKGHTYKNKMAAMKEKQGKQNLPACQI